VSTRGRALGAPAGRQSRDGVVGRLDQLVLGRPETGALVATLGVLIVFTVWAPYFLSVQSIASTLTLTAELGIVAMGVTLLMIAGEFDLSVGSVLGVSSVLVPWFGIHGLWLGLAIPAALLTAAGIGLVNGLVVVTTRIPSFIVTLGGLLWWRGVLFVVTQGFPLSVPTESALFQPFSGTLPNGINYSAFWLLGLFVLLTLLLERTGFGNWVLAAGGNERAARQMGVPVDGVRLRLFVLTATLAGLAGLIQVGRYNSVDSNRGSGLELEAIAAAVIGGSRLSGGYGSIVGTVLGCLMVGMIRNGLVLAGVASYWYQALIGLLIVAAVIVNQWTGRANPPRA
jgi:simple sugar transport system permease protein